MIYIISGLTFVIWCAGYIACMLAFHSAGAAFECPQTSDEYDANSISKLMAATWPISIFVILKMIGWRDFYFHLKKGFSE